MFPFKPLALVAATFLALPISFVSDPVPATAQATQDQNAEALREATRLFSQGVQQYQTSQFEAALRSWQQALALTRQIEDRNGEGVVLNNLGLAYDALNNYPEAIACFQQALVIVRESKNRLAEGKALGNLGNISRVLGKYAQAIEYHQQALAIAWELKDRQGAGQTLGNLGIAHQFLGNYGKAIEYHQQSLAIARETQDRRTEGNTLGNLGDTYQLLGNYTKAIEYQQQALAIAREFRNRLIEGRSLSSLGNAYQALGNYAKAIEYHQQSLAIAQAIKDRLGTAAALGNIGLAYQFLGRYAKAIEYQQQRLVIARQIQDRLGIGQALGNLGLAYQFLGDYAKAIDYQQQRLAIAQEIKDRLGQGQALSNLGLVYQSLGNYAKAIEYHQQALAITQEIKDQQGEGIALGNLGNAYDALDNPAKAIEYHQQHLAIARQIKDRKGEGLALGNLGNAYWSLSNYAKAIESHQQALAIAQEIKDRFGEGQALGNLANSYDSLGNYGKAIEYQQQALAIAREIKNRLGEGQILNNLGLALLRSKNLVKAEQTLLAGIEVWEALRAQLGDNDANKISIFEEQARTYGLLQQVLVAQSKTDAALEIAERGRSRAFVELLAKRLQKTGTAPAAIPPPNLQQIRQIAKTQNATLVQYSTIRNEFLYIWVIKPTGAVSFRQVNLQAALPKGVSLEEYVRTVRSDSLGVRGLGVVAKAGAIPNQNTNALSDLHRLLIDPIATLLPTNPNDRIIFLPQGSLFLVPFAALKAPNGKYLIEQRTILTSPSIQVLELTRQKKLSKEKVTGKLIVGNPTMPSIALTPDEAPEQLPKLPGAEAEAEAIAQFLQAPFLTGNQATKAIVKQQMTGAKLIHLATHGLLDDRRGIGSAIALAPSGSDNGLLTAEEILDLKLNADLVVLSACDTGRGKITGDGVIGLSRSLISAGAPSVIVSLWAVPDAPTSALMTQFYRNLQQNPDKAQSLRQAMLTTLKQHPKPRDWAAFTLIGEAE